MRWWTSWCSWSGALMVVLGKGAGHREDPGRGRGVRPGSGAAAPQGLGDPVEVLGLLPAGAGADGGAGGAEGVEDQQAQDAGQGAGGLLGQGPADEAVV